MKLRLQIWVLLELSQSIQKSLQKGRGTWLKRHAVPLVRGTGFNDPVKLHAASAWLLLLFWVLLKTEVE